MARPEGAFPDGIDSTGWLVGNLPLSCVLAVAFVLRVLDLDYNGPFIDESFHSVVLEYGNVAHLTGEVYLYPLISRFVHESFGLVGARFLSAVFGTLTVGCIYKLAEIVARRFVPTAQAGIAGFSAGLVFCLSASPLFISQFANYYAMSFMLFAFGLWQTARGIERGSSASLAVGAVALVASYATRYLLLGYLPLAVLYVLIHADLMRKRRVKTRAFWLPFVVCFAVYSGWNNAHILAAVNHAQWSAIRPMLELTLELRALVLVEALGRMAPALALAPIALVAFGTQAVQSGDARGRAQLFDLAWLVAGSLAMVLYHVVSAHDMTMESNLTVATMFASVLAGLGAERLATGFVAIHQRVLGAVLAIAATTAAFLHTRAIVDEDQLWPDWRPVVEAALARGVDRADAVWSTADNGGMLNTWGVRRAFPRMSGNVWHLRAEIGEGVDTSSPWYEPNVAVFVRRARREGIEFIIGPMPYRKFGVGDRLTGYVVTDIVVVPHGPEVYILQNLDLESQ